MTVGLVCRVDDAEQSMMRLQSRNLRTCLAVLFMGFRKRKDPAPPREAAHPIHLQLTLRSVLQTYLPSHETCNPA
jgi:hypothetical protein